MTSMVTHVGARVPPKGGRMADRVGEGGAGGWRGAVKGTRWEGRAGRERHRPQKRDGRHPRSTGGRWGGGRGKAPHGGGGCSSTLAGARGGPVSIPRFSSPPAPRTAPQNCCATPSRVEGGSGRGGRRGGGPPAPAQTGRPPARQHTSATGGVGGPVPSGARPQPHCLTRRRWRRRRPPRRCASDRGHGGAASWVGGWVGPPAPPLPHLHAAHDREHTYQRARLRVQAALVPLRVGKQSGLPHPFPGGRLPPRLPSPRFPRTRTTVGSCPSNSLYHTGGRGWRPAGGRHTPTRFSHPPLRRSAWRGVAPARGLPVAEGGGAAGIQNRGAGAGVSVVVAGAHAAPAASGGGGVY